MASIPRNGDGLGEDDDSKDKIPRNGDDDVKKIADAIAAAEIDGNKKGIGDLGSDAREADPSSSSLMQEGDEENQENRNGFLVGDLVWGRVEGSDLWWPGQIITMKEGASKASFLVCYFRRPKFEWVLESQLLPFRPHFSRMENQDDMNAFSAAVDASLEEVRKQIEAALACNCSGQEVDKTGIDRSFFADQLRHESLVEYARASGCLDVGFDRLELTIAKAQLKVFRDSIIMPDDDDDDDDDDEDSGDDDDDDADDDSEHNSRSEEKREEEPAGRKRKRKERSFVLYQKLRVR